MKKTIENPAQIVESFAKMQSMDDLLEVLNQSKILLYGKKAVPFDIRQLNYYSISKYRTQHYKKKIIPKKSGGKRIIHAPTKGLKHLQATLNLVLQTLFEPHRAATGFVPGKSIVDNAKRHVGKGFVYNIDLKDFFPSIDQKRIWATLQLPPFNLGDTQERKQLANRIAILCCTPLKFQDEDGTKETRNVLPQGAPTSPTITNIVAQKLDRRLQGVANKFRLTYSRYADDITFSSNKEEFNQDGSVVREIRRIVEEQNFVINEAKVRLQQQGFRQEVTGLIVNKKVNVPRKYIRQLRQWLYLWETYGHDKAYNFFINDYVKDKGHVKSEHPSMICVIGGKMDYLKMVKGDNDETFIKLNKRYLKLVDQYEGNPVESEKKEQLKPKLTANAKYKANKPSQEKYVLNGETVNVLSTKAGGNISFVATKDNSKTLSRENKIKVNDPILHTPKQLVDLLNHFSKNAGVLKYTTHSWEYGSYGGYEDFIKELPKEWSKISSHCFNLKKELFAKINAFLVDKNVAKKGWGDVFSKNRIRIGWSSPELKEWCVNNPEKSPFYFPITRDNVVTIDGITTDYFYNVIEIFKRQIEIREENNQLYNLILDLRKGVLGYDFNLEQINTKGLSFFTDVQWIKRAIEIIFESIRKRPHFSNVKIIAQADGNEIEIKIIHLNSTCNREVTHNKIVCVDSGDFESLKNALMNLCDWSIESKFNDGKYYRVNHLVSNKGTKKIIPIMHCEGFTHVLKFYL